MEGYDPDRFNSFATKAVEGLRRLYELLSIVAYFLKVDKKRISAWLSLSMRILIMSHLSMWTVMTMASVYGNKASLMSWIVHVICIWDHLVWVMKPSTTT
jgi:hypothetical protein